MSQGVYFTNLMEQSANAPVVITGAIQFHQQKNAQLYYVQIENALNSDALRQ
jgi:hypothetical protein